MSEHNCEQNSEFIDIYSMMREASEPPETVLLSPSRMNVWLRCKRQYYWSYYMHLAKSGKSSPLGVGLLVGETLANYYRLPFLKRSQEIIPACFEKACIKCKPDYLQQKDIDPSAESVELWEGIMKTSARALDRYHEWAVPYDRKFRRLEVETNHIIPLTNKISLQARPDGLVEEQGQRILLEHKCRGGYRPGDFGLDVQSMACCLTSEAIGTYYNIILYEKMSNKYIRQPVIRFESGLKIFQQMFIDIGTEILETPPRRLHPHAFKRCSCDFWELCLAVMSGTDLETLVNDLYHVYTPTSAQEVLVMD
jgi:hypothetical protein